MGEMTLQELEAIKKRGLPRGARRQKEKVTVVTGYCQNCGNDKLFFYHNPKSMWRHKCTKCQYGEYR